MENTKWNLFQKEVNKVAYVQISYSYYKRICVYVIIDWLSMYTIGAFNKDQIEVVYKWVAI